MTIKTHTTYTYETSDGREFKNQEEAQDWQLALDIFNDRTHGLTILDAKFNPTTDICSAFYVWIKNQAQLKAYQVMSAYEGVTGINDLGFWMYNEYMDRYDHIDTELEKLLNIKAKLLNAGGAET